MRALVIGRYQPPHKGHVRVLSDIAAKFDDVVVGIGSGQASHTHKNPFTAGERVWMLSKVMKQSGKGVFFFVPIIDVNRNAIWVRHVESMCPPIDVVFSNNPLVRRLFSEAGFDVRHSPLYERETLSGTEIRRRIVAGEDWESLVPPEVADTIKRIDGVERIRTLEEQD